MDLQWILIGALSVWAVLATLALVGLNKRLFQLRDRIEALSFGPAEPLDEIGSDTLPLPASRVVLLVDALCMGCELALDEAQQLARTSPGLPLLVLEPATGKTVRHDLPRLADDQLFREAYPGYAPALLATSVGGSVRAAQPWLEPGDLKRFLDNELNQLRESA